MSCLTPPSSPRLLPSSSLCIVDAGRFRGALSPFSPRRRRRRRRRRCGMSVSLRFCPECNFLLKPRGRTSEGSSGSSGSSGLGRFSRKFSFHLPKGESADSGITAPPEGGSASDSVVAPRRVQLFSKSPEVVDDGGGELVDVQDLSGGRSINLRYCAVVRMGVKTCLVVILL